MAAVSAVIPPGATALRVAYGPYGGPAYTSDPYRAEQAQWPACYTRGDAEQEATNVQAGLRARTGDLVSRELADHRVLVVGAGSVGSVAAEYFVRAGVRHLTMVDPEPVRAANLSRTAYDAQDVGRPKVAALARRLLQINPLLDATTINTALEGLSVDELDAHITEADIAFVATDNAQTQLLANRALYSAGTPAVFAALFDGARGGEVVITAPEDRTACYLCTALTRQVIEDVSPAAQGIDYSTGRLQSVVALAPDIHHVTAVASKLTLALLARTSGGVAAEFIEEPLAVGETYLVMSMTPRYWFFPEVFGATAGQYAYQSIWAAPRSRPECPICGDEAPSGGVPEPVDTISVEELRDAVRARRQAQGSGGHEDV